MMWIHLLSLGLSDTFGSRMWHLCQPGGAWFRRMAEMFPAKSCDNASMAILHGDSFEDLPDMSRCVTKISNLHKDSHRVGPSKY